VKALAEWFGQIVIGLVIFAVSFGLAVLVSR